MNYFFEKDFMNTKNKVFALLISKYEFVSFFSHALYKFSLYL